MPFNSTTYYLNKHAREAWAYLAKARDLRDRQKRGEPIHPWESGIDFNVRMARSSMKQSLTYRRIREIQRAPLSEFMTGGKRYEARN
jgi:hypothetical protein